MRLCLVSAHYPPDRSGMGDYTHFLACALATLGHETHVLTATGSHDEKLYPVPINMRVHRVARAWSLGCLPGIVKGIRRIAPDVVLLQYTAHAYDPRGLTLAINLLPWMVRVATHARVLVNFHEIFIPFDGTLKHVAAAVWQRLMAFVIAAPAHELTAISAAWPDHLRRVGVLRRIAVIPVGSNIPRTHQTAEEVYHQREVLGAEAGTLVVGCFGSTGPDRDLNQLREAVSIVERRIRMVLVWIGGSGSSPKKAGTAWPQWKWTGYLPHPEVSRILAACDCVILPFADGVSTKRGTLAAALSHGVPLISTAGGQGHAYEPFVDGENLRLVRPGNPAELACALLDLATQAELRKRLSYGGFRLYQSRFDWLVIARQVISTLGVP